MTSVFFSVLLAAACLGSKAQKDEVFQPNSEVTAAEGDTRTLSCRYTTVSSTVTLFWYKQVGHSRPTFILMVYTQDTQASKGRFSSQLDPSSSSAPLKIQDLQESDSSVYFCALQPDDGSYRLFFGSGSRLTVDSGRDVGPSFFRLDGNNNKTACLATGFSRHQAVSKSEENDTFAGTLPARISGSSLYSQLALLTDATKDRCETGVAEVDHCEDVLETDEKMNLTTLTILVLRLLFIKTVVLNVVMSVRFWTRE